MSSSRVWMMGSVALVAALAAVGVGLNGYRSSPRLPELPQPLTPATAATPGAASDPLAPRLFDRSAPIRVHVAGAVRRPGVYGLSAWARVEDALKKAGGAATGADLDAINLADRLRDGEQVRFPYRGRPEPLAVHPPTPAPLPVPATLGGQRAGRYPFAPAALPLAAAGRGSGGSGGAAAGSTAGGAGGLFPTPINLNTATREQLDQVPGIGPATAERIIAHREQHGPFQRPEDLLQVDGIGPGRFAQLRGVVGAP